MGLFRRSSLAILVFFCGLQSLQAQESAEESSQIVVMPLTPKRIAPETVSILDDLLLAAVSKHTGYEVIGISDIEAMLGLEKFKDVLGCDDLTCAVEIGGTLGIDELLAGSVARLGDIVIINIKLINTRIQKVEGRGQAKVKADESLFPDAIELAVKDLFAGIESPVATAALQPLPTDVATEAEVEAKVEETATGAQWKRIVLWSMAGVTLGAAGLWAYYHSEARRLNQEIRDTQGSYENQTIQDRALKVDDKHYDASVTTAVSAGITLGLLFIWEF